MLINSNGVDVTHHIDKTAKENPRWWKKNRVAVLRELREDLTPSLKAPKGLNTFSVEQRASLKTLKG